MKENTDPLLYQAKLTAVILRMFCFINYSCFKVFPCKSLLCLLFLLPFLPSSHSLSLSPSFLVSSFFLKTNKQTKKSGFISQYTEGKKSQGSNTKINMYGTKLVPEFEIVARKELIACMIKKVY